MFAPNIKHLNSVLILINAKISSSFLAFLSRFSLSLLTSLIFGDMKRTPSASRVDRKTSVLTHRVICLEIVPMFAGSP